MAKFFGNVGYAESVSNKPGVWTNNIIERPYYGDLIRNNRRLQNNTSINGEISISNQISILADPYANENFHNIKYVVYMDTKWIVTDISVEYPRLVMTLGGVYNDW